MRSNTNNKIANGCILYTVESIVVVVVVVVILLLVVAVRVVLASTVDSYSET